MRKTILIVLLILIVITAGVVWYAIQKQSVDDDMSDKQQTKSTSATSKKELKHVIIIVEENKPYSSIVGSKDAPYFNGLLKRGASAKHYSAITNPSLPNYIALTSGTTADIDDDCSPPTDNECEADVTSIADSIEESGRTWKMYAEDMPGPCTVENNGKYAVRHNPFMYYPNVRNNAKRCLDHVVPFGEFEKDLAADKLPNYVFISPNLCNDMHDCSVRIGDNWLAQQIPAILASPSFVKERSLLVITWDEGVRWNNNIPTLFLGSAARENYVSEQKYDHYSLLRTIEDAWDLPTLTENDREASTMSDMLR